MPLLSGIDKSGYKSVASVKGANGLSLLPSGLSSDFHATQDRQDAGNVSAIDLTRDDVALIDRVALQSSHDIMGKAGTT